MKGFHLRKRSRSVFSRIGVVPARQIWEPVDPVARDNDKRNNIQIYIYIYMYVSSLLNYTKGGDKTSEYSHLVVILSNWVWYNWVYRLPTDLLSPIRALDFVA